LILCGGFLYGQSSPTPLAPFDTLNWTDQLAPPGSRLILTPERLRLMKDRIAADPLYASYYQNLRASADALLTEPVLERKMNGRRLLPVSREAMRRATTLGLIYRLTEDDRYLDRLAEELNAVSDFSDWNPEHFLDVAEMSMGVATALDWTGDQLPPTTREAAYDALYRHGLATAMDPDADYWWVDATHNWNQVCHGGTIAAALVLAERYPEMAERAIARAIHYIPLALETYAPDGAYPEGPNYWGYGTGYTILTSEMLRTALGTDYGIAAAPGFMESGRYARAMRSPEGLSFNYGDNGMSDRMGQSEKLIWFAKELADPTLYLPELLAYVFDAKDKIRRAAPFSLIWLAEYTGGEDGRMPEVWTGGGPNPVFTLRDEEETSYFLAGKGGRASVNHGNQDAGSFVFELDGVRWAHDLGSQPYNPLEELGLDLWNMEQDSERWTLISKNNYNHNTLTVNDSLHRVDGFASLKQLSPTAFRVDMGPPLAGQVAGASRTFDKDTRRSVTITDSLTLLDDTRVVSWRMLTRADVILRGGTAVLQEDGKQLIVQVVQPAGATLSVVSLDPPPLPYDKRVEGLKRLQVDVPAYILEEQAVIQVRLRGE
jgi:hypothetical protein